MDSKTITLNTSKVAMKIRDKKVLVDEKIAPLIQLMWNEQIWTTKSQVGENITIEFEDQLCLQHLFESIFIGTLEELKKDKLFQRSSEIWTYTIKCVPSANTKYPFRMEIRPTICFPVCDMPELVKRLKLSNACTTWFVPNS